MQTASSNITTKNLYNICAASYFQFHQHVYESTSKTKKKCGSFLKRMVSHFSKKITQTSKIKVHEIVAH